MAAPTYIAFNATSGSGSTTTAAPPALTYQPTGTSARSMFQIKPGTPKIRIVEWGYFFDVVPTALVKVSLVTTGTTLMTMNTALAAGDVMPYNDSTGPASQVVTGLTSGTAFNTGTATETTISTNVMRYLAHRPEWGQSFAQQFPLGREPEVNGGTSLRIVATTATSINMSCYVVWEE